jgi:hypothetical protein
MAPNALNRADLFAKLVDGVYTIERTAGYAAGTRDGLYGLIQVADLPLGAHSFKVVKTYPDGRVETVEDRAQVTGVDANQVAVFGTATLTGINNSIFRDNFLINEAAYVKGQYKYEFTIAGVSKTYIVNVLEAPAIKITSLKIGTVEAAILGGAYTFQADPADYAADVVVEFDLTNLDEDYYVSVVRSSETSTGATARTINNVSYNYFVNNQLARGNSVSSLLKMLISDLDGELLLGDITAWNNPSENDKVVIHLEFWKKNDYSVLGNGNIFEKVGETQVITFGFVTKLA